MNLRQTQLFAPEPTKPPIPEHFSLGIELWIATWEVHTTTKPIRRLHRSNQESECQQWGEAWAKEQRKRRRKQTTFRVVESSPPLVSEASDYIGEDDEPEEIDVGQPEPSGDDEVEAVMLRLRQILAELASRAPYGKVVDYWLSFEWTEWIGEPGFQPYPWQTKWWGRKRNQSATAAWLEIESAIREILSKSKEAAALYKYTHPAGNSIAWVEIPWLAVRWKCETPPEGEKPCSPEKERKETSETIALVGERPKRTRRKAKRKARRRSAKARMKAPKRRKGRRKARR